MLNTRLIAALAASALLLTTGAAAAVAAPEPTATVTPAASGSPSTATPVAAVVPGYDPTGAVVAELRTKLTAARAAAARAKLLNDSAQHAAAAKLAASAALKLAADRASASSEAAHTEFAQLMQQQYVDGPALSPAVEVLVSGDATSPEDMLDRVALGNFVAEARADELSHVITKMQSASRAAAASGRAYDAAVHNAREVRRRYDAAVTAAATAESQLNTELAREQSVLSANRKRSQHVGSTSAAGWTAYLAELRRLGITPPAAADVADPTHLPHGLSPVTGRSGKLQPGVAQARTHGSSVLVLPHESIAAVNYALAQLGKPYVWAADGPASFDCSGLTMMAWRSAGFSLPHLADGQYRQTAPVAIGDEVPGDLLYFAGDDGTVAHPGHVAIVLDSTSKLMVQAPQTGDVVKVSSYVGYPPSAVGRVVTAR